MTRDHKLILGGAVCGSSGAAFALGLWAIALALVCAGSFVIWKAGEG